MRRICKWTLGTISFVFMLGATTILLNPPLRSLLLHYHRPGQLSSCCVDQAVTAWHPSRLANDAMEEKIFPVQHYP